MPYGKAKVGAVTCEFAAKAVTSGVHEMRATFIIDPSEQDSGAVQSDISSNMHQALDEAMQDYTDSLARLSKPGPTFRLQSVKLAPLKRDSAKEQ